MSWVGRDGKFRGLTGMYLASGDTGYQMRRPSKGRSRIHVAVKSDTVLSCKRGC